MPYTINIISNVNSENSSSHNSLQSTYTDGELSITEHSHMQTRHSFLVYNVADRSNHRYGVTLRHAAVWSSAKPTPHTTILRSPTNVHQLRLRLNLPNSQTDVFKLRHKVTPKISSVTCHSSPHFTGLITISTTIP